ncbi:MULTISPECIES: sulfate ABC transporter substrate-binding protein [unclassified Pseudomonas]|uniref:sulfate ABC transporter substrate-binding protein n=1 Tax=unclassified Pseudomonas TaxID=196821 RepID=UPI002AC958CD|nr:MULTISPECIES: sulfate ABC transporter substrate-binding protein [unclassified Pseudomonas]MEB0039512.1 sulfate ABC transporter substrate-binding protein [Pseudomonas sp. MH10]MEB0077763.1 sulfate ABC transporter substrate-binding protein [Pseudomonas sp. MH10out]MEB0092452.1 sulfate ABC transporter substrate-binding protein [Pseudomonas sp. CCI4.2]MEB0102876.1 sulfate ABC transporter substrate-binding protein [Pseudomonas sp. CCI3.2]MEB0122343.1 sulfate ABC transporter substrate-binding pro
MSIRLLALAAIASAVFAGSAVAKDIELLNVSYDPTRELYQDYNAEFISFWKQTHADDNVKIQQSHGGSGKQGRAVIDGLRADVVTLALAGDIDEISKLGQAIPANWQTRLPDASTPYTSTIVFLVRKGNPKGIKDWGDLIKKDVSVITPNPKTSGGARWNFLAAWAYGLKAGGSEAKAQEYVQALFKHVPILDTGARGSTITFVNNGQGDVLLAWENEAYLALKEDGGADKFDIVVPSLSILAEPPVSIVDKNVDKKGTREIATAYLEHLYSPAGQEIAAKNFYRPRDKAVAAKYANQFPKLDLVTIDKDFGGWKTAQPKFFNDGGVFDQIYQPQ